MLAVGLVMAVVGLTLQAVGVIGLKVSRHRHRNNKNWRHLSIFKKWWCLEAGGAVSAWCSFIPFKEAQASIELAVSVVVVATILFAIALFNGDGEGEGEGANYSHGRIS